MGLSIRQLHKTLTLLSLVAFIPGLLAEQTAISDYVDARDNYFYDQLYTGTLGVSLYCGIKRPIFDNIE